jgi:hypothetical protein
MALAKPKLMRFNRSAGACAVSAAVSGAIDIAAGACTSGEPTMGTGIRTVIAGLALVTLVAKLVIEHRLHAEARELELARSTDGTTHDATPGRAGA